MKTTQGENCESDGDREGSVSVCTFGRVCACEWKRERERGHKSWWVSRFFKIQECLQSEDKIASIFICHDKKPKISGNLPIINPFNNYCMIFQPF